MGTRDLRLVLALFALLIGCSLSRSVTGTVRDGGVDARTDDDSDVELDASDDAAWDVGSEDAGSEDAGLDAPMDAGTDGGGGPSPLDLFAGGTFTRGTEASYLTGAPTDGVAPFLAWALPDTRRIEDRGDGTGSMLLLEGERTNLLVQSRGAGGAGWALGSGSFVADSAPGPDGAMLADRAGPAASAFGPYQVLPTPGPLYAASLWARVPVPGSPATAQSSLPVEAGVQWALPPTGAYVRGDFTSRASAGVWAPWDARGLYPGIMAQPLDYVGDLHQVEAARFPSSSIRTGATAGTRGADILRYASGQYPDEFLTQGFQFTFVPDASSAEIAAGTTPMRLLTTSPGDYVQLVGAAGNCIVELAAGGATVTTIIVGFPRLQPLTITVEPVVGRLTVMGARTGGGTATGVGAPWTPGGIAIGSNGAGLSPAFGRFARYVAVP